MNLVETLLKALDLDPETKARIRAEAERLLKGED